MILYDLVNRMTIQGAFVEIKVYNAAGEETESECFEDVDDLSVFDIEKYWDMEVKYIYTESITRYYPNCSKPCANLVIEVAEDD